MKINKISLLSFVVALFFSLSCVMHVPPGQIKKETTPGHIKKHLDDHPGKGK
ncbi:MAG TPA: hypothetical protein VII00_09495 [bacterium]